MLHRVLREENQLCKVCISENRECMCVYVLGEDDAGAYSLWESGNPAPWLANKFKTKEQNELEHLVWRTAS